MSNPCTEHFTFPEIETCVVCREAYERILLKWYGEKAVQNFRENCQREILNMALKEVRPKRCK